MQVQELKHLGNDANKYTDHKQGTKRKKWLDMHMETQEFIKLVSQMSERKMYFSSKCITATQLPFGKKIILHLYLSFYDTEKINERFRNEIRQ